MKREKLKNTAIHIDRTSSGCKINLLLITILSLLSCSNEKAANDTPALEITKTASAPSQQEPVRKKQVETPYEKLEPGSDEKVLRYYLKGTSNSRKYNAEKRSIQWKREGEEAIYSTQIVYSDTIQNRVYQILETEPSPHSDYRYGTVIMTKSGSGGWICHEKVTTITYAKAFHSLYRLNSSTIGYGFEKTGLRESHHTTDLLELYTIHNNRSKKVLTVNLRESWESENWEELKGELIPTEMHSNSYSVIQYVQKGTGYAPDGELGENYYDEYCSFNGDIYECAH